MPVAEAKLTRSEVEVIKQRIIAREPLSKIAAEHNVGYMTIYKIAIGATWKTVKPRGRLIGMRDYSSTRSLSAERCEAIALIKIRKRVSFEKLAARLGVSAATVRRAADIGYAMLGIRLLKHRKQGTIKRVQAKLELTTDEIDDLILAGSKKKNLPRWARRVAHGDDEEE